MTDEENSSAATATALNNNHHHSLYDDDGRPKRTGTVWTTSSHIITAVIGSGVLSLAWSIGQLGWIGGPLVMLFFSLVTLYTSYFLADSYRVGDPINGKRSYTYMEAIDNILGGKNFIFCGIMQYTNLYGTAIGYTIGAAISMMAITKADCIHSSNGKNPCPVSGNRYIIGFGAIQLIFSQIPNFHKMAWLSILAAVMSFTYSLIGLGLGIAQVAENGTFKGTISGAEAETHAKKVWAIFQALGNIAFAYSYSNILIEIQDTIKSPFEVKTMKIATKLSIATTTTFYVLCGCIGYGAFGNAAPGNLLTAFDKPYWLIDIANLALVIHLVGAYQVYSQPLFAFVEEQAAKKWKVVEKEHKIQIPFLPSYNLNTFRLVWRSFFVVVTTFISMLIPFFNDILGVIGALGFWPLTVYFPVEMYIRQKKIPKWCGSWIVLQSLSMFCLLVTIAALIGSVAGVVLDLKTYKPFSASL
ncbi:Amino acid permease 4 [Stylosanthes scabra]|uniref:Amino acid permease 4 n=1 Tax=Stylosanthes scabra TaxID=79078 RepID=A0ABU6TLN4_9FABA|nr:Amino acid permease 4 [Stylosanthes scabra]